MDTLIQLDQASNADFVDSATDISAHLALINEMSRQMNLTTNESAVFDVAAKYAARILSVDRTSIAIKHEDKESFYLIALQGESGHVPVGIELPMDGSSVGYAYQNKAIYYGSDYTNSRFAETSMLSKQGMNSGVCIPLITGGKVIGTLNAARADMDSFKKNDFYLLHQTASLIASNLESRRLMVQLHESLISTKNFAQRLGLLNRMSQEMVQVDNKQDLFRLFSEYSPQMIQSDRTSVGLPEDENTIRVYAAHGEDNVIQSGTTILATDSLVGRCMLEGKLVVHEMDDASDNSKWEDAKKLQSAGLKVTMSAPMIAGEKILGTINIASKTKTSYDDNDKNILLHMGSVLAITLDNLENKTRLAWQRQRAESAANAKGEFLANMSHEIRTPMNGIIGLTELMQRTTLNTRQQGYLNKIEFSAKSLLGIINDILDFSKIEAGKLTIESINFDLNEIINNVHNLMMVKVGKKEVELKYEIDQDIPLYLIGDPLRLTQILINLSNNAVKFTESGSITVHVVLVEEMKDNSVMLQFSVKDTGIGMSKKQQKKLFQAFSQAESSTTRKYGGTGLGLNISKNLVEMMDGKIWVSSTPGEGSTFYFLIRLGVQKILETNRECPRELENLRVLLVEDHQTTSQVLLNILQSFSFDVELALSGKEVLAKINKQSKKSPYQLVVLDQRIDEMNGMRVVKKILSHTKKSTSPAIVMMSNEVRSEIEIEARKAGVDVLINKPVDPSLLFDAIMSIFGKEAFDESVNEAKSKAESDYENLQGVRVLLVEDNEINQVVAEEVLEQAGLLVTIANDGLEAVNMVSEGKFDVVLMDINMPNMDGFTATNVIRDKLDKERLPIIAMTAHAVTGYREKCIEAGMNDYVTKPININELFTALAKLAA